VVFVLFGASRIPAAFRSLGEGINSFKEGLEGDKARGGQAKAPAEKAPAAEGEVASKS
jgi:TatA/E family protein of Tat protein translocase